MQIGKFLWSDNWWLEKNKAYVCAACYGELLCIDMITGQCEILVRIPDCYIEKFRSNSYCRKYKNKVFFFPYEEKNICCYDLESKTLEQIKVGFKGRLMICMENGNTENSQIWLMEHMGKKIYQVNLEKRIVEKEYVIFPNSNSFTGCYIFAQDNLYCTAGKGIYCIDISNGNTAMLEIAGIESELYTICYDGHNFWLSGNHEVIYVWNPIGGIVQEIKRFLDKSLLIFQESSIFIKNVPLFSASVSVEKYIWFIPLQCNAPIIYIDKENYEVGVLEIENEQETEESVQKRENTFKYVLEYVREDRYIGLYSYKNQVIFEIDTAKLCIKIEEFKPNEEMLLTLTREIYSGKGVIYEGSRDDEEIFSILLNSIENRKKINVNAGQLIYSCI